MHSTITKAQIKEMKQVNAQKGAKKASAVKK